ncbi:MAG: DivIVA domain-containing protein [Gemmatimonadaceae bacterium]|nr:DivIVA domain-containing protein [Gemmatimonadaceae bacterium]
MEQDDAFHLTAVDVRRYEFQTVMRGYDRARVDQFKQQVADEMERLMRANQELDEKARGFHEQLRAFRERDRALNEALVSAQQIRAEMKEQAGREADVILQEARLEAQRLVDAARAEAAKMDGDTRDAVKLLKAELDRLERTRRSYLANIRALAERHLAEAKAHEEQGSLFEEK